MSRGRGRAAGALLAVVCLAVVVACTDSAPEPEPVTLDWQELTLPMPDGPPGRLAPREVVTCAGKWFVTGTVVAPDGGTRPAVWESADGRTWTSMLLHPKSYYGIRSVVYSAGCKDGQLAALGGQVGGAHGNPRVNTWYELPDGSLDEIEAPFEQYGGPSAVNVSRLTGGSPGFLITGNRATGAATWTSPDAAEFRLREGAPELRTDDRGNTWAADATAVPSGWLLVGGLIAPGRIDRDPLAWTSADGVSWQRVTVPGDATAYDELQRVAVVGPGAVAIGLRGGAFGAWRLENGQWRPAGSFGGVVIGTPTASRSLTVVGERIFATVSSGPAYGLWQSSDGAATWRSVPLPVDVANGVNQAVATAGAADRLVVLTDDGRTGRLWSATVPIS